MIAIVAGAVILSGTTPGRTSHGTGGNSGGSRVRRPADRPADPPADPRGDMAPVRQQNADEAFLELDEQTMPSERLAST